MNPVVLSAAIGVSGTVIVGVAGFGAAIWHTRKTLADAHENRLWDQRATVYVDTIAAVHYRQVKRNHETNAPFPPDPDYDRRMEAYLSAYKPPDWHLLEARALPGAIQAGDRWHPPGNRAAGMLPSAQLVGCDSPQQEHAPAFGSGPRLARPAGHRGHSCPTTR